MLLALDVEDVLLLNGILRMHFTTTYEEAEGWLADNTPDIAMIASSSGRDQGYCRAYARRSKATLVYSGLPIPRLFDDPAFIRFPRVEKPAAADALSEAIAKLLREIAESDRPLE